MFGVSVAAGPHFVQQECAGRINAAVQVVAKAAIFFARGTGQRAEFRFEQRLLAFASTQKDGERDGILWKLLVSP